MRGTNMSQDHYPATVFACDLHGRIYPFSTPNRSPRRRKPLVKKLRPKNSAGHVQTQAVRNISYFTCTFTIGG